MKKASCLFQNTKSEKCDFHFSPKINDLGVVDFAGTSIFRYQASKFFEFQQPASIANRQRRELEQGFPTVPAQIFEIPPVAPSCAGFPGQESTRWQTIGLIAALTATPRIGAIECSNGWQARKPG
ncbi:hypothetical protein [Microbulbifer sp. TYP-18]|uniref:hypothetical protein n=1 Tax=Microbulbifer sp. TYP-18 TaxID=3230024 RepID=UPI0034C6A68B